MDDLFRSINALQDDVADMRERQGEIGGEIKQLSQSMNRLVGIVEGNQRANETAHRAQDDRTAALHGDIRVALSRLDRHESDIADHGIRLRAIESDSHRDAGGELMRSRLGEWVRVGFGGIIGAIVALVGQMLSGARH